MMPPILGATLYIPATRPNIERTIDDPDLGLRSAVVCLEDSVAMTDVEFAREAFVEFVGNLQGRRTCRIYARPRDLEMLIWMRSLPGIERLHGFVIPKVTNESLGHWLGVIMQSEHTIMPTIEGAEAFDMAALEQLRHQLTPFAHRVDAVRIGGNDILNVLGARRSRNRTAYEGPLGPVIRDFAAAFIPHGFNVSAPVFEHFEANELLEEEVERDLDHGITTKTAIHPRQVQLIHRLYRPRPAELAEARAILDHGALAVFASRGSMCEPATHRSWAASVVRRAQAFGVAEQGNVTAIKVA